jgi:hypothetical protein
MTPKPSIPSSVPPTSQPPGKSSATAPYFFHQLSGDEMEIRTAGADRRLWTAGDRVLTP